MKSFQTKVDKSLRNIIVYIDYIFWLIFDLSKFKRIDKNKIKKVLIIHLGAMGELIITTPIISTLKKELNCEIDYMVSSGKEKVLESNPKLTKILTYNNDNKQNLIQIKNGNYDMVLLLWPCYLSLSYLLYRAGIKYRIGGFKNIRDGFHFFFTRMLLDIRTKHAVETNLDIIRTFGLNNLNPKLELFISKEDKEKTQKILQKYKLKNYALIHPGFSFSDSIKFPSRLWPYENYAQAADFLIENYNYSIVLSGNDSEKIFSEKIYSHIKNKDKVVILNGMLELKELYGIINKSKLVISTGTGVLHIASAFDKNIIALLGKENPKEWHPYTNENNYKILFHPEVCTECDKNYCRKKTQECMLIIKPSELNEAIKLQLKK